MTDLTDLREAAEKKRTWMGGLHSLVSRLRSRSRTETFVRGSLAPELLRRSEEMLVEATDQLREDNATILSLLDRLERAEEALTKIARRANPENREAQWRIECDSAALSQAKEGAA